MGFQNRPSPFAVCEWGHFEVIGEIKMSKDCKPFSVELSAYFDDELEGEELEGMEAHLSNCEDCQQSLKKLNVLRNALATMSKTPTHRRSVLEDLKAKLDLENNEESSKGSRLPS